MKNYLFILFLIFTCVSRAQSEDIKITWIENSKLTWEDFQGIPPKESLYHANTNAGLSYSWRFQRSDHSQKLVYNIDNFFYIKLSWVHSSSKSDILLNHEQLHFDISELHARKLRNILSNIDPSKLNNGFKSYSKIIYQQIVKENKEMQNAFDKESNHSLNKEAELKWQQFVEEELNKFKDFSS